MPEALPKKSMGPRSLREIQISLARIITDPKGPRILSQQPDFDLSVVRNVSNGASALDRVSVYADAYFLRLREILESDFELARAYLGPDRFVLLIAEYLSEKPPFHPDAAWVGSRLPRFVETHVEWSRIAQLYEILSLEWSINETVYAPWIDEMAAEQLLKLGAEDLSLAEFDVDPSVRLVFSPARIEDAWLDRARSGELDLLAIQSNEASPWIVLRRGSQGEVKFTRFNEGERILWLEIGRPQNLTETCEKLSGCTEVVAALQELGGWAQRGLIKKIRFNSSSGNDEDQKKGETLS